MAELTGAQFLSEATAVLQAMAEDGIRIDDRRFERYVRAVITEYDRRGDRVAELEARVQQLTAAYTDLQAHLPPKEK